MIFIPSEQYANFEQVQEQYLGAVHIEPVQGGWMVFDSASDFNIWSNQK